MGVSIARRSPRKQLILRWQAWVDRKLGIRELHHIWRKQYVFLANLTPRKTFNVFMRVLAFALKLPALGGVPIHIKVDVAPQCQLRCPICLHSTMEPSERATLPKPMALETFEKLVDQVRGRTLVMALYNLGEPMMNKALGSMIRYARAANINTYFTSNFSVPISEKRMADLASSGLTLLIVAVDGISNETYGRKRVNGKWDLIDSNLRRFIAARGRNGTRVTLQYLVFDHNRHEVPLVREYCLALGIDDVFIFEGDNKPWLEQFAPRSGWLPKRKKALPLCAWPFLSTLIGPEGNVYGCCHYRMDENYLRQQETRPLGNITEVPMEKIYASEGYRKARRLVSDPARHGQEPDHFCNGCPVIQERAPKATFSTVSASL